MYMLIVLFLKSSVFMLTMPQLPKDLCLDAGREIVAAEKAAQREAVFFCVSQEHPTQIP